MHSYLELVSLVVEIITKLVSLKLSLHMQKLNLAKVTSPIKSIHFSAQNIVLNY